jgi:gluconokinase
MTPSPAQPVHVIVMGVSGTGKSSVAEALARQLGSRFIEGDALHPESNVQKMAAGTPLTDEDRWPWLDLIVEAMREEAGRGGSLVVTCSALRRSYREVLAANGARTVFVHLSGSRELIASRLGGREGHFFPQALLDSQFDTLEPLRPEENGFAVDVAAPVEREVEEILELLPRYSGDSPAETTSHS